MNAAIAQNFSPDVFEQCCRYQAIAPTGELAGVDQLVLSRFFNS
jgi:hypothetical protein